MAPLASVSHLFTSQLFHSTSVLSLDLTVPRPDHSSYTGCYGSALTPSNPSTACPQKSGAAFLLKPLTHHHQLLQEALGPTPAHQPPSMPSLLAISPQSEFSDSNASRGQVRWKWVKQAEYKRMSNNRDGWTGRAADLRHSSLRLTRHLGGAFGPRVASFEISCPYLTAHTRHGAMPGGSFIDR